MLPAKLDHSRCAGDTVLRLQRSGFVVNAGVNNAAVMTGLMARNLVFFFDNRKTNARLPANGLKRGRQSDNSTADDDQIELEIHDASS